MALFAARHAAQARYEAGIDLTQTALYCLRPRCRSDESHMTKRPSCDRLFRFCERDRNADCWLSADFPAARIVNTLRSKSGFFLGEHLFDVVGNHAHKAANLGKGGISR